jgi:tetrapyrrole methylase family protein/MazG family protein
MARLRAEGSCPWDRERAERPRPYLIEKHEVVQRSTRVRGTTSGELGDLLFQVVFHCQIAGETGEFTMSDVLDRLTRR